MPAVAAGRQIDDVVRHLPRHQHDHPPVRDLNTEADRRSGALERLAGSVAAAAATPAFVAVQAIVVVAWVAAGAAGRLGRGGDLPRLLDLVLGVEVVAVLLVAVMLLGTAARRDRLRARQDYETAVRQEEEMRALMTHLEAQDDVLVQVLVRLDRADRELRRLTRSQEESQTR